jgi:hypothetical protein
MGGLHQGFAQGEMGVDGTSDLLRQEFSRPGKHKLRQQLGYFRPDQVSPK